MYRFDPTLVQIVLAAVAMTCAGFLAAWAVIRGEEGTVKEPREGAGHGAGPGNADRPLETRQKVMVWTAAAAAALFLLWWTTLSTGSAGRPPL